jgi:ABC-2 type transport system permease protein
MTPFIALTRTELKLNLREPLAAFFTLVFPLMVLVMFGSIFGNQPSESQDGWGSMDLSVQGYFAMIVGTVTLLGLPVIVSAYREYRIFRRMRATPLRPMTIILAHTTVQLIMTTLGLTLLLIAGALLYDLRMPENPMGVIVGALVSFLAFASIGFLIGGVAGTSRTAQVVGNVFYFPQLFLAGAAMPRELFPDSLRTWTAWLPMTQVVNVIKDPWKGEPSNLPSLAILIVMGVVCALVSSRVFRWE